MRYPTPWPRPLSLRILGYFQLNFILCKKHDDQDGQKGSGGSSSLTRWRSTMSSYSPSPSWQEKGQGFGEGIQYPRAKEGYFLRQESMGYLEAGQEVLLNGGVQGPNRYIKS